jgi:cytochrome c553
MSPIRTCAWKIDDAVMNTARSRPAASLPAVLVLLGAVLASSGARAQSVEDTAQACAGCHGETGTPQQSTMPVIWGQQQGYLYLQLRDFKSGARKNDIMTPIAQALERADMQALALYFSQKPWPNLQQPRPPADVAARATQAATAVGCNTCHQSGYLGDSTQPRLAGQTKEYLQQTMLDFRNRSRGNNPGMTDLMLAISEDDIVACAAYLAAF